MLLRSILKSHATLKSTAVAVLLATGTLGACLPVMPAGGGFGGPGPVTSPNPAPIVNPAPTQPVACQQRFGSNGGRGFWDVGLGQCWSCPADSARTIFDVRGSDACQIGGIFGSMVAAEYLGN